MDKSRSVYFRLQKFVSHCRMDSQQMDSCKQNFAVPSLLLLSLYISSLLMKLDPHMMPTLCGSPKESPLSNLQIVFHLRLSFASPSIS